MDDPLDRPVWSSLAGRHAHLAEGDGRALRYRPSVNVFVVGADREPETLAAVAALVEPGERVFTLEADPLPDLPQLATVLRRPGVQMTFDGKPAAAGDEGEVVELGEADAPEMLALATLTEPGPFRSETRLMGRFVGIRRAGRLAAMAGERLHPPGHVELSGVCTHPDFRGQGLGSVLSAHVTRTIAARGETPFLHAWKDNAGAIALYERLGYRVRREMAVAVFERAAR